MGSSSPESLDFTGFMGCVVDTAVADEQYFYHLCFPQFPCIFKGFQNPIVAYFSTQKV